MSRYKDRQSAVKTVNEDLKELLPHLQTLREDYKDFIESEKGRIKNQVENLKTLLNSEFSDNIGEDLAAVEILKQVYAPDQEIIEELLNDN